MHWSDIEKTQPRLAGLGHERLIRPGVVLVATIRQDGTARLSPVEPLVLDGDFWLSMMWQSAKARDVAAWPGVHPPRHVCYQCRRARAGKRTDQIRLTAGTRSDASWLA